MNRNILPIAVGALLLACRMSIVADSAPPAVSKLDTMCGGIDRTPMAENKADLERAIAEQLGVSAVKLLPRPFKDSGWSVVCVEVPGWDDAFLFYSGNPLKNRYVTKWSGAAAMNEYETIRDWVIANAPKIPPQLAQCFAWCVTNSRD